MPQVVIDTCVLLDIEFKHRGQHAAALNLARMLKVKDVTALVPAHWFFEFVSAVICEKKRLGAPLEQGVLKSDFGFPLQMVPIDNTFINDFLAEFKKRLIDLAGGDLIFAVIALKNGIPLITEDRR